MVLGGIMWQGIESAAGRPTSQRMRTSLIFCDFQFRSGPPATTLVCSAQSGASGAWEDGFHSTRLCPKGHHGLTFSDLSLHEDLVTDVLANGHAGPLCVPAHSVRQVGDKLTEIR